MVKTDLCGRKEWVGHKGWFCYGNELQYPDTINAVLVIFYDRCGQLYRLILPIKACWSMVIPSQCHFSFFMADLVDMKVTWAYTWLVYLNKISPACCHFGCQPHPKQIRWFHKILFCWLSIWRVYLSGNTDIRYACLQLVNYQWI